jgi:hypothetical protein
MVILHSFNILKRNCSEERGPRKNSNIQKQNWPGKCEICAIKRSCKRNPREKRVDNHELQSKKIPTQLQKVLKYGHML